MTRNVMKHRISIVLWLLFLRFELAAGGFL